MVHFLRAARVPAQAANLRWDFGQLNRLTVIHRVVRLRLDERRVGIVIAGKQEPRLAALLQQVEGLKRLPRNPRRIQVFRRVGEEPYPSAMRVVRPGTRAFFNSVALQLAVFVLHVRFVAAVRRGAFGAKRAEIVKAERLFHRIEMQLAGESRRVAVVLHDGGQEDLTVPRRQAVPTALVDRHVAAVEHRVAGRRADWRRAVEVGKAHAARGQAVEHRRPANGMARATEQVPPHLVHHDDEHVWPPLGGALPVAGLLIHVETP